MKTPELWTKHNLPRVGSVYTPKQERATWKMVMFLEARWVGEEEKEENGYGNSVHDFVWLKMLTSYANENDCEVHTGYIEAEECVERFKVLIP